VSLSAGALAVNSKTTNNSQTLQSRMTLCTSNTQMNLSLLSMIVFVVYERKTCSTEGFIAAFEALNEAFCASKAFSCHDYFIRLSSLQNLFDCHHFSLQPINVLIRFGLIRFLVGGPTFSATAKS